MAVGTILTLALGLAAQEAPGTRFRCAPVAMRLPYGFDVFVPADKARAGYRTSLMEALRRPGARSAPPFAEGFEQVEDALPARLLLSWRREHNSPVKVTITDYDAAAGTAKYTLASERNPASRVSTMTAVRGICTARAVQESSQ